MYRSRISRLHQTTKSRCLNSSSVCRKLELMQADFEFQARARWLERSQIEHYFVEFEVSECPMFADFARLLPRD
jgi:hypothetical protein